MTANATTIARVVNGSLVALVVLPLAAVLALDRAAGGAPDHIASEVAAAARAASGVASDPGALAALARARDVRIWIIDPVARVVLRATEPPRLRSDLGVSSIGVDPSAAAGWDAGRAPPPAREQVALAVTSGSSRACAVVGSGTLLICEAAEQTPDGKVVLAERMAPRVASRLLDARIGLLWLVALASTLAALLGLWLVRRLVRPLDQLAAQVAERAGHQRSRIHVAAAPREVEQVGAAVDRLVDQLAAERQRQVDAAADLAHELKGPLARIRIALEDAEGATSTHARAAVAEIDRTVGSLLEVARAEAGLPEEPRVVVDLLALCRRVAATRDREITVTGVSIHAVIAEHAVARAVSHLLDNACAFARELVTIEVVAPACIVVADDGAGIAADLRPRLFERFASRRPGGSGLGLAYVRAVAEAHRGTIALAPGSGTRFVLDLAAVHTRFTTG